MTNLQALIGEVEPYTVSPYAYSKRLIDRGIDEQAQYVSDSKMEIAKCAISILVSLLPLSSDGTGKSSQSYNREGLEERIGQLCAENGLDADEFLSVPIVEIYPDFD